MTAIRGDGSRPRMKRISLALPTIFLFFLAVQTWAGEDKGTIGIRGIGIFCVDLSGKMHVIPREAQGAERERAIAEFRKCVKWDIERSTDNPFGTSMLLEKAADGGTDLSHAIDPIIMRESTIIRNVAEEVKLERERQNQKKKPKTK